MKRFCTFLAVLLIAATAFAATTSQIEQIYHALGRNVPAQTRQQMVSGLEQWKNGVDGANSFIGTAQVVATDHSDATLQTLLDGYPGQLVTDFGSSSIGGINGFAQAIADFQELAGLEGTANELRLYKNGVLVPVTQDQ